MPDSRWHNLQQVIVLTSSRLCSLYRVFCSGCVSTMCRIMALSVSHLYSIMVRHETHSYPAVAACTIPRDNALLTPGLQQS